MAAQQDFPEPIQRQVVKPIPEVRLDDFLADPHTYLNEVFSSGSTFELKDMFGRVAYLASDLWLPEVE